MPIFLDDHLKKVTNEDNTTSLVFRKNKLGNSSIYQWFYKTVLYYVVMYAVPLLTLAVLTGLLLRALAKAKMMRGKMTGQNVRQLSLISLTERG